MKGLKYVRFCQKQREDAIKNSWKLRKLTLKDKKRDVLIIAKELELPPLLVMRRFLSLEGCSRKQINQVIDGTLVINQWYTDTIRRASKYDFINSPLSYERSKERGLEGELILREWMDLLGWRYDIDLANGVSMPDLVLYEPMTIYNREVDWIESKASYGGSFEMRKHRHQFKRFDTFGNGIIVFWFGYDFDHRFPLISGLKLRRLMPPYLRKRVDKMLSFVPPEFIKYG